MTLLLIAIGGLIGTVARYLMTGIIPPGDSGFPRGTLVVNVLGSIALGFLMRYGTDTMQWSPAVRSALTIGFCGAFTTMSTFAYETVQIASAGQVMRTGLYVALTAIGCFGGVVAGSSLASRLL